MANEEAPCEFETIFASELSQDDYSSFYLSELFADVQLIVDGREIKAHKIILAVRSKYFASILVNNLKQSKIIVKDIKYESFLKFLSYIYTGSLVVDCSDVDNFVEILRFACLNGMEDLKQKIIEKLCPLISTSNISTILNLTSSYNLDELKQFCYELIEQNVAEFLNNSCLNNLTQKTMVEFLERDSLTLPEINVFEIARKWCSVNKDVDNLVIKCVRLSCLTKAEIYRVVKPSKLFDTDTLFEALEKIDNGQICGLQRINKNSKNLNEIQRTLTDLGLPLNQNISSLDSVAIEKAKSVINLNNVFYILNTANLYELVELRNVCHNFMDSHVNEILSNEFFITLSKKSIINLLERNDFAASEIDVFNAVLKWSKTNNVYDDSVLSCVRLLLLSIEDLISVVWPTQLIKTEKLLDAIAQIVNIKPRSDYYRFAANLNENIADLKFKTQVISGINTKNLLLNKNINYSPDNLSLLDSDSDEDVEDDLKFKTQVISGCSTRNLLFNRSLNNFSEIRRISDYAYHPIQDKNGIVIKLAGIYHFNHIKFRLYDGDQRSYSYYIEVSVDSKQWKKILDYSEYWCRSVQELYFEKQQGNYIRIVGTANTAGPNFELVNLEVLCKSEIPKFRNGIVCPVENVAALSTHAVVIEGQNPKVMLDETKTTGFTQHRKHGGCIMVQLAQPYNIANVQFLLDARCGDVRYLIETSVNRTDWSIVADLRNTNSRGWQRFAFDERPVVFFRITGTYFRWTYWFGCRQFKCSSSLNAS